MRLVAHSAACDLLQVVLREYKDNSRVTLADSRGGPGASSHVEVLGNNRFLEDLLFAAAGWHEKIDEDIIDSRILEVAKRIDQNVLKMGE